MAYPNDLSNVAAFKVHPALGVTRLANNDDQYEFFEYEAVRERGQAQTLQYMSIQDGHHMMMRQSVRFRVFAYAEDGTGLGELSQNVMDGLGIVATWTASVSNRKLNNFSNGNTPVINASGSAGDGDVTRLEGDNPWHDSKVWLGDITGNGTFVPPKGGVYRQTPDKVIPAYGNHERDNGVQDTTGDGSVTATLEGAGEIPVLPAAVIIAPQQHSPDVNPGDINNARNKDFVRETRRLLGIPENAQLEGMGYAMDIAMMRTINAEYNPGMEICLNPGASLPDPAGAFYTRGTDHIADAEIRPMYQAGNAEHGALTAGLCSAWQTDLNACLNYWTSEFPNRLVYDESPDERFLSRKAYADEAPRMENNEDLNAYIDMMGVGRDRLGSPFILAGTERDANDDAGPQPQPPFPLDPPN